MFATIANRYDLANRVLSAGRDVSWRRSALKLLDDKPDRRLLDLACGTFDLGLDALSRGHASSVIGGDFCPPMLHAGAEKITEAAVRPCAADALRLPFADDSFDAAMIAYGWRNVDDPLLALRELKRVIKPGGQLLILEFFHPSNPWSHTFYQTFGRVVFPVIGGLLTGDASAYRYLRESVYRFVTTKQADELLDQADFGERQWRSFFAGVSHAVCARVPLTDTNSASSSE